MKLTPLQIISGLAILLIIALFGVLTAVTPYWIDDLWYLVGTHGVDGTIDKAVITLQNCYDHWLEDTGRLINLTSPIFLCLMPKGVYAVLTAFMTWIMLDYVWRLSACKSASVTQWLIVAAVTLALPWLDEMTTVIYSLNYVWVSAISLYIMCRMLQLANPGTKASLGYAARTALLCVLTGWLHEGFSIPIIAGWIAFVLTIGYRKVPRRTLTCIVCYCIGTCLILISPSIGSRMGRVVVAYPDLTAGGLAMRVVVYNSIYFVYVIALAAALLNKNMRKALTANGRRMMALQMLTLTAATVGIALFIVLYCGPRMGWLPQLMSIIGLATLLNLWLNIKRKEFKSAISLILIMLVTIANVWINGSAIALQLCLNKEMDQITEQYLKSDTGTIYYDRTPYTHGFIDSRTTARQFEDDWCLGCFEKYYCFGGDYKQLDIYPTSEAPTDKQ